MTKRTELQAASVDTVPNTPVGADPEVFIAEHEGKQETTRETAADEDGNAVTTTHTRSGRMTMYKPHSGGYAPRTVSTSALRQLLRQGWREVCPDCNKAHLNSKGEHSCDPNLCDARPPVAVRICPVCQHRIYDNVAPEPEGGIDEDDPNVINEAAYTKSDGASRTKDALDVHMWRWHPRRAHELGVAPLPTALRDMVGEESKA